MNLATVAQEVERWGPKYRSYGISKHKVDMPFCNSGAEPNSYCPRSLRHRTAVRNDDLYIHNKTNILMIRINIYNQAQIISK